MSIFSLVDAAMQQAKQQAMIADVEALLGKLAMPKIEGPMPVIEGPMPSLEAPAGEPALGKPKNIGGRRGRKPTVTIIGDLSSEDEDEQSVAAPKPTATFSYPYRRNPETGLTSAVVEPVERPQYPFGRGNPFTNPPAPKPRRGRKPKAVVEAPKLNAVGKPEEFYKRDLARVEG